MSDSLVIANQIELVGPPGGQPSILPGLVGVTFNVDNGYTLDSPHPVVDILASLVMDGERPYGRRSSNRQPILPVNIVAPNRDLLIAAREYLLQLVDQDTWTLTWTRENANPIIFDCFRQAPPGIDYEPLVEEQNVCTVNLNVTALPYGRSDTKQTLQFGSAITGQVPAPSPIFLYPFTTVAGGNPGWTESTFNYISAPSSAYYIAPNQAPQYYYWGSQPSGVPIKYSATFPSTDISQLTTISFWAGLEPTAAAVQYFKGIPYTSFSASVTLFDNHGIPLALNGTFNISSRGQLDVPQWVQVNIPIVGSAQSFDYTHVVSFSISLSNATNGNVIYANVHLDSLWALASTTQTPASTRGALYALNGIIGTSHAPLSLTVQQAPSSSPTVFTLTPASPSFLCPAGGKVGKVEATGPGGAGSTRTTGPVPSGTAIGFIGASSSNTGAAAASSFTINKPAAVANGHLMLMTVLGSRTGSTYNWANVPAGWNVLSAGSASLMVCWRIAASEPSSYTVTMNASCEASADIVAYSNCDPVNPVRVSQFTDSGTGGGVTTFTPTEPAGPVATDVVVLSCGAQSFATGSAETITLPGAPWTVRSAATGTTLASGYNVQCGTADDTGVVAAPAIASSTASRIYGGFVVLRRPLTGSGAGGGGGGGGYGAEPACALTPGQSYTAVFPVGGAVAFADDNGLVVVGNPGLAAPANSNTGGAGGTASGNTISHAGSAGQTPASTPTATGGSGGSPGNAAGTPTTGGGGAGGGNDAAGSTGNTPGYGGGGGCDISGPAQNGGAGGLGNCVVTVFTLPNFNTTILHLPGPDSPDTFQPYVPMGSPGTLGVQVPIPQQIPGFNARFNGTVSVVAVFESFGNPSATDTVSVTVYEWEYPGAATYSASQTIQAVFVPNQSVLQGGAPNGIITIGELSLPYLDIAPDNTATYYTVAVNSSNASDQILDILFLDTMGQTCTINNEASGYAQYFLDEPDTDKDLGRYLGTPYDRPQAISVMQYTYPSGGPLTVQPGNNLMLAYCVEGAPALTAAYAPRWFIDRLANQ